MASRNRSNSADDAARGWRNPMAPAVSSKLARSAPRRATPVSSPELERRRRRVAIIDYHIHHATHPFVLYRLLVAENAGERTIHRRYNDFAELHRYLTRTCSAEATHGLVLPGKRVFKRKKFEPAFLDERKAGLDAYLQRVMATPELRMSDAVRDFLSDAWRLHMETVAARPFSFLPADTSFLRPRALSSGSAGIDGIAAAALASTVTGSSSGLVRSRSRSLIVPQIGNVLSPPQQRRSASASAEDRHIIRPRGLRRPPVRKMPMPLNLKSDLHHPVYIAVLPRLLELRREFDTEKQYVARGTPVLRNGDEKARRRMPDLPPLPPPPKGFFDDHFPDTEIIKKQQAFLKEYHRRRFVKPALTKPP